MEFTMYSISHSIACKCRNSSTELMICPLTELSTAQNDSNDTNKNNIGNGRARVRSGWSILIGNRNECGRRCHRISREFMDVHISQRAPHNAQSHARRHICRAHALNIIKLWQNYFGGISRARSLVRHSFAFWRNGRRECAADPWMYARAISCLARGAVCNFHALISVRSPLVI